MATKELVTEQFQLLGIDLQDDVLKICVSLCQEYDVDAEAFVEKWMAFSLSQLNGASPTIDDLKSFERKEFSKRAADKVSIPAKGVTRTNTYLTIYGAPEVKESGEEILSDYYISTSPKKIKVESEGASLQKELKPVTYSPSVGHSAKYSSRTNAGSVVHSFGEEALLEHLTKPNNVNNVLHLNIVRVPNDDGELYTQAMFGYELLHEKASIYDSHIEYLSQCIMKKANIKETVSVGHKSQSEVYVAGRIECDADARLNPKSVVLQGTWEQSLSLSVPVDLELVQKYSLFPGQVVVMRGINPRGDKFIAQEIFCDASKPLADHRTDLINSFKGTMSLVIASGPYTTSDTLTYQPLKDLVQYIGTYKPHVVIMTGPFVDSDHGNIKDNTLAETYKSFFEKLLDMISEINSISAMTQTYIVSSLKDAFHFNIYPTPPYTSRKKHNNINFLPDPCTLNINGIHIGVTSTDILMHLSQEEISFGACGDKLSRLSAHVAAQQGYYPLCGGGAGAGAGPHDAALWAAHAQLSATPHILVLPSNFRYFVKEVNGCVVVNPEHLTKGTGGGTFARVLVSLDNEADAVRGVAAQIVRI